MYELKHVGQQMNIYAPCYVTVQAFTMVFFLWNSGTWILCKLTVSVNTERFLQK